MRGRVKRSPRTSRAMRSGARISEPEFITTPALVSSARPAASCLKMWRQRRARVGRPPLRGRRLPDLWSLRARQRLSMYARRGRLTDDCWWSSPWTRRVESVDWPNVCVSPSRGLPPATRSHAAAAVTSRVYRCRHPGVHKCTRPTAAGAFSVPITVVRLPAA